MIYKLDLTPISPLASPSVTGSDSVGDIVRFVPWQPSSWPPAPADNGEFAFVLKHIFEQSMLMEINNVIHDATAQNGGLEHRGHVVAISMLCALDAISSYGYGRLNGRQIPPFIRAHFPDQYRPFADDVLKIYRHAMIHSWNLFEAAITPGNEGIVAHGNSVSFGLLDFFEALKQATENFLEQLAGDAILQRVARERYDSLSSDAQPA